MLFYLSEALKSLEENAIKTIEYYCLLNRDSPYLPLLCSLWMRTNKIPAVSPYFIHKFYFLNEFDYHFLWHCPAENIAHHQQNFLDGNKNTISYNDTSIGKFLLPDVFAMNIQVILLKWKMPSWKKYFGLSKYIYSFL